MLFPAGKALMKKAEKERDSMDITIRSAAAPDIPALARMFQELVDS